MPLLGGIACHDPHQQVENRFLRAMASGVADSTSPAVIALGPVGFMNTGGAVHLGCDEHLLISADLDLTNFEELSSSSGSPESFSTLLGTLYLREGWEFVKRLEGGFALALWDRRKRELLLAVDRFGIKRLYYTADRKRLAFATRAGMLDALPGTERALDPAAAFHYLNFGYVPAPHSIYSGLHRLPPGHALTFRDGATAIEQYWDLSYSEHPVKEQEGATRIFDLTESAVRQALSGIPPKEVGAFLSGGTDSSTVVGLMGRVTRRQVNAFSIGFKEERYNELGYAETAARHFGAGHYQKIVTPEDAFAAIPPLIEAYDEPFGNNSVIPTYLCVKFARECGVTHMLAGDGGDEIFGGNERYRTNEIFARYGRIPRPWRRGVIEPLLRLLPDGGESVLGKAQRYVRRANIPNPERFYSYNFLVAQEHAALLTPEFVEQVRVSAPWDLLQRHYDRCGAQSELNRLLYLDMKLTIGDNDLFKVTRSAETAGIAVRFPMLDHRLVEFTATLPAWYKVKGLQKRYLFKQAFANLLPPEILAKPKQGFGLPVSFWLKSHTQFKALARDALLSQSARQRGYFRPEAMEELFRLHAEDRTPFYGDILWVFLMLELWQRRHLDGKEVL